MNKRLRTAFIFIVIGLVAWQLHCYMPILIQWVQALGVYAFIGFFLLYCFAVLLFLPTGPLVLVSGALFGFTYGFVINLFCAVTSATIAFILSRYWGLSFFSNYKNGLLIQWLERIESLGWKSLAVSRLTPFVPCAFVNYGYGLTKMRLFVYISTNLIFFIPYKLIITYLGSQL